MSYVNKIIRWCSQPQGWMMLGPLCLLWTLTALISKYSQSMAVLGIIAICSIPLVWRFQLKGFLYSAAILCGAFLFSYSLVAPSENLFWTISWCVSLCLSSFVVAWCSREYSAYIKWQEEEILQERRILKDTYEQEIQHLSKQIASSQDVNESLEKSVKHYEKELSSLKLLLIAAKEEADKYFMQCEHLKEEAVTLQKSASKVEAYEIEMQDLLLKTKKLQHALNEERVAAYQQQMLLKSSGVVKKEEGEVASEIAPPEEYAEEQLEQKRQELLECEEERTYLKNLYLEHFRQYQALSDKLQVCFNLEESGSTYVALKEAFEEEGRYLQSTRIEIFKIEGAILQLKKELKESPQDAHLSPGSYLAIADQECLRLEEENSLLLQLLTEQMEKAAKKNKPGSLELIESQDEI